MWLIDLLVTAAVLVLLARLMPTVTVRNYLTALIVALVIGLLNATLGWVLRGIGNLLTLGLLSFVIRLLVTAAVIVITDKLFRGFQVKNYATALIIALVLAVVGSLLSFITFGAL